MSLTTIMGGYGGQATIGGVYVMLTSYNLTIKTNYIRSSASDRIFNGTKFTRQALGRVRDFIEYDLQLQFDATKPTFNKLLGHMIDTPHNSLNVTFQEKNYGLKYVFSSAYISSVNVTVGNNALCTINVDFAVFSSTISVEKVGKYEAPDDFNITLMPYYGFNFSGSTGYNGVLDFNFTISQSIERRFGCTGTTSLYPQTMYLVFEQQNTTYSCTYLNYGDSSNSSNVEEESDSSNADLQLTVKYNGTNVVVFNDCIVESESPELVDPSGHRAFQVQGSVFGKLVFNKLS